MAFDYINEAFKKLEILDEDIFNTSYEGVKNLSDFIDRDVSAEETVRIIDPEAESEEDIQDSYVGKVIVNCNVCHSHIFENKEEITIDDEGTVNADVQCPYCGENEGFIIVGEIAPYSDSKTDEVDTIEDNEESEIKDDMNESLLGTALAAGAGAIAGNAISDALSEDTYNEDSSSKMSRATRRSMQEDFKEVSITTEDQHMEMTSDENGKVTVTTEPVEQQPSTGETIVPVSDETTNDIIDNNVEEPAEQDSLEDTSSAEQDSSEEETTLDFDDVDEEGLNELGESFLRKVYKNVDSYKTTSVGANSHALVVEGLITFNSGVKKHTGFIFESRDINKRGKVRFSGSNDHICESKDAFSLIGTVNNNKLFVESLKYDYQVKNNTVRGLVRRKRG